MEQEAILAREVHLVYSPSLKMGQVKVKRPWFWGLFFVKIRLTVAKQSKIRGEHLSETKRIRQERYKNWPAAP